MKAPPVDLSGIISLRELMAMRFPPRTTLDAYRDHSGRLHAWCDYCRGWHVHSPGNPRCRPAHCRSKASPYRSGGYDLHVVGNWPVMGHGEPSVTKALDG